MLLSPISSEGCNSPLRPTPLLASGSETTPPADTAKEGSGSFDDGCRISPTNGGGDDDDFSEENGNDGGGGGGGSDESSGSGDADGNGYLSSGGCETLAHELPWFVAEAVGLAGSLRTLIACQTVNRAWRSAVGGERAERLFGSIVRASGVPDCLRPSVWQMLVVRGVSVARSGRASGGGILGTGEVGVLRILGGEMYSALRV